MLIAFWILSAIIVICALGAIALRSVIHSALSMALCFVGVAGIFILLNAELIALFQILIYVGAITVLILFTIMLTPGKTGPRSLFFHRQQWVAIPLAGVFALVAIWSLYLTNFRVVSRVSYTSIVSLSKSLFTTYAFPFEVSSVLLLAAIVGAVALVKSEESEKK